MPTSDETRALLKEVLAESARDKKAMRERFFSPDSSFYEPESLPYGGRFRGDDEAAEFRRIFTETWSDISFDMWDMLASETRAATFGKLTLTSRETGRTATITLCEVWEFADGKVVRVDAVYGDTVPVLQALAPDRDPIADPP